MSRLATYHARCIVLRSRIIGEKDRVMTLLCEAEGKLDAVAKGARNPKSKLAAMSQPFTLARVLMARGKTLDIVSQAEIEDARTHIAGDLLRTAWASYLCELCCVLPERQPDAELFELLDISLRVLNDETRDSEALTLGGHWFEAQFLVHLGYTPQIGTCVVSGEKIVAPKDEIGKRVLFSPQLGGTISPEHSARDPQHMTVLASSLRALFTLMRSDASPLEMELTTLARRDLKNVLQRLIGAHLDVHPRSRKFLDDVLNDAAHQQ